jgi:glycosyltransferase involved in cell wall biosynthesis
MSNITVSVVMVTYKHEQFIRAAVLSVIEQIGDFELELIVADDLSPDHTPDIVNELIANHPYGYRIKYTRHTYNKGMMPNFIWALEQCKGKYVALCDGDDYWTDPYKLQKQVDFLEANPEYVMVFGNTALEIDGKLKPPTKDDFSFQRSDLLKSNILGTKTCVSLFKNVLHKSDFFMFNKVVFGDWLLWIMLLKYGKGYVMKDVLGVYRIHGGGIWSSLSEEEKFVGLLNFYDFISANLEELRETAKQAKLSFIKTSLQHQQVENRKIFDYLLLKHKVKMKLISIISKPHE